jgi:transposase-like protein
MKRARSMVGFKSYETATSILNGSEGMHMMKKEQLYLMKSVPKVQSNSYISCLELHHNL